MMPEGDAGWCSIRGRGDGAGGCSRPCWSVLMGLCRVQGAGWAQAGDAGPAQPPHPWDRGRERAALATGRWGSTPLRPSPPEEKLKGERLSVQWGKGDCSHGTWRHWCCWRSGTVPAASSRMSQDVMHMSELGGWKHTCSKAYRDLLLQNPLSTRLADINQVSLLHCRPPGSSIWLQQQHHLCHSLGTHLGHPGLAAPVTHPKSFPGKCVPCYSTKEKNKKEKVNEKTSWKCGSTVNATAVMLHLSCKEKIKFCLPPEMSLGKMIPSFSKWHHIVSSLRLAASLVSQPVFPGQ